MTIDGTKYSVIESIEDSASNIEFWSNSIIYIKLKNNIQIELEDAYKQFLYLKSKYDGMHKDIILLEPGLDTSISKEARGFSTKPQYICNCKIFGA